jgi:hypothetical protein
LNKGYRVDMGKPQEVFSVFFTNYFFCTMFQHKYLNWINPNLVNKDAVLQKATFLTAGKFRAVTSVYLN